MRLPPALDDARGLARDLASGLSRPSFRDSLAAELGLVPDAVTRVLPWVVRARDEADWSLMRAVDENAARFPWALALEQDDERLTWAQLSAATSRTARALWDLGVRRGDVVALIGHNSPGYLVALLAITRLGGTAALVNNRLEGQPLSHAVLAARSKLVVVERELAPRVEARPEIAAGVSRVVTFRDGELDELAARALEAPLPRARVRAGDDFCYIYTSGTTGLPKPCHVTHGMTIIRGALAGVLSFGYRPGDKLYSVLPLYHSSALLLGFAGCVVTATPMALRGAFSARAFFPDVVRYHATATLYIGELCRYLLATPPCDEERDNPLRIAMGNGLRSDLWGDFQRRFGVPEIREFYGATEAPGGIVNFTNRVGSVGRLPMRRLTPIKLVRYDVDRDEHVRGPDGLCVECGPGEVGELVVVLKDKPLTSFQDFKGYTDAAATKKKLLFDVRAPGDRAFRSGDLLRFDEDDYFYFVDRIGDTFRFKGENVSTAEVAEIIGQARGVSAAQVTGLALPGVDGRAGLATVVCDGPFDASAFSATARELPDYAQPRLVHVTHELATTGTFKLTRKQVSLDTLDPARDELWWRTDAGYERLDARGYEELREGRARL
ncbi:MAG: long-chain-acyl-CoA synthetase [Polyangiaceae bacterium]|nr:long-chain-acyl-CoA synthetase [Polyangiaceae bacterium]